MRFVSCSVPERYVNPLFEVFDGGDFVLSSFRDINSSRTELRIYFELGADERQAEERLKAALGIVGLNLPIEHGEIVDEDWKFAYRRDFKVEEIGNRLVIVPAWEKIPESERLPIVLDPGMAFGTGKHETTRACLTYIDELSTGKRGSFLDMGCGSGILSIAAYKLGFSPVVGFDVDQEAVDASVENAMKNSAEVEYRHFALGRTGKAHDEKARKYDLIAANILGPLLIRFADEICEYVGDKIIISGILDELYPEVVAAYTARGLHEISHRTIGEWTTGLLER